MQFGSYNKVIEEQYDINVARYCKPSSSKASGKYEQHRLCNECNSNQEMKIKLLANFVPLNENNFDKEVTEFRKHLEDVYKLCYSCELLIDKVLEKPKDFSYRRSPQKPPTLNSTADYSSIETLKSSYKNKFRFFTSPILPTIAYIGIIATIFYLFGLSNSSFIEPFGKFAKYNYFNYFKNSFSLEHTKLYEKHYLVAVFTAFSFYTMLIYTGKTLNLFLDSLIVVLFCLLASNSFSYRLFNLAHDSLIDFHQMLFAFIFFAVQFNGLSFLYRSLSSKTYSKITDCDTKKTFNFIKLKDETTFDIRQQIKDLCLTDLGTGVGQVEDLIKNLQLY